MLIYEKKVADITIEDLKSMVNNEDYLEDNYLEFKSEMKWENFKGKLLKTVCGFANANGGLFIYGVEEKKGKIIKLSGVSLPNDWDMDKNTIENWIIQNSEPKIYTTEISKIDLDDSKVIILIKVSRSWDLPHRVKINKKKEFYIRRNGSTDPMEMDLLRRNFELSGTLMDKIYEFRDKRISKIYMNQSFCNLNDGFKIILHLIPYSSFIGLNFKLNSIDSVIYNNGSNGFNEPNFEGLIDINDDGYTQFFRNGIIEKVYSQSLDDKLIDLHNHYYNFTDNIKYFNKIYEELNILPPYAIFVTMVNIKDCYMKLRTTRKHKPIDENRDVLAASPILIEQLFDEKELSVKFKPLFIPFFNHFKLKINED